MPGYIKSGGAVYEVPVTTKKSRRDFDGGAARRKRKRRHFLAKQEKMRL
ncbi:hypothetical protein IKD57_02410 [Candidatus Saccharibacteria bacterium]|nr:hypothetical protein [Candidatus Saccharibacteria bacterium]